MPADPPPPAYESPRSDRPSSATPPESALQETHDPYAAFRFAPFRYYAIGNLLSVLGRQMLGVGVGWEVYRRTHSATALGLVGLVAAIPVIVFAIPAGQVADRFSRKKILLLTQAISAVTSLGLAWISLNYDRIPSHPLLTSAAGGLGKLASAFENGATVRFDPAIPLLYALLLFAGSARAFGWAARGAFLPNLVPARLFSNAVTWNSTTFETGSITGPAIAGLLLAGFGFPIVYAIDALCALVFFALLLPIRPTQKIETLPPKGWRDLFSGLRFVWNTKIILATVTLDMFAVLLGGATALLPIFADRILHCGPIGLGWLRAAPSLGAVSMAFLIAHARPMQRPGRTMLFAVAGFGVAVIVFGFSRSFWLSMAALIASGMCDNISVVVRHTLVQLLTPDTMRGRVSAVNNVFIGSSNELGAFESGIAAALFGPVVAVVAGGIGTILIVLAVRLTWSEVARLGPFRSLKSQPAH